MLSAEREALGVEFWPQRQRIQSSSATDFNCTTGTPPPWCRPRPSPRSVPTNPGGAPGADSAHEAMSQANSSRRSAQIAPTMATITRTMTAPSRYEGSDPP
jgi:hypothetical protein